MPRTLTLTFFLSHKTIRRNIDNGSQSVVRRVPPPRPATATENPSADLPRFRPRPAVPAAKAHLASRAASRAASPRLLPEPGRASGAQEITEPASEPARDADQHTADTEFVDRDVRAVAFERPADIGGEAPVPQRSMQHPDADTLVAVDAPGSEKWVRRDVPEDAGACIDGYRKASLERPRCRESEPDHTARVAVLLREPR